MLNSKVNALFRRLFFRPSSSNSFFRYWLLPPFQHSGFFIFKALNKKEELQKTEALEYDLSAPPVTNPQTVKTIAKEILIPGDGKNFPQPGQVVGIEYLGKLTNNKIFDTTRDRGLFRFVLGAEDVLKGWEIAFPSMSLGERSILILSPEYGLGEKGFPPNVPPNATLIFDVTVMEIEDVKKKTLLTASSIPSCFGIHTKDEDGDVEKLFEGMKWFISDYW